MITRCTRQAVLLCVAVALIIYSAVVIIDTVLWASYIGDWGGVQGIFWGGISQWAGIAICLQEYIKGWSAHSWPRFIMIIIVMLFFVMGVWVYGYTFADLNPYGYVIGDGVKVFLD